MQNCFKINKIAYCFINIIYKIDVFNRFIKLKRFESVSNDLIVDIIACLKEGDSSIPQLIAIKPLVIDIRKIGIKLLEEQKPFGKILYKSRESSLYPKLKYLLALENTVKNYEKKYFDNFEELDKYHPESFC